MNTPSAEIRARDPLLTVAVQCFVELHCAAMSVEQVAAWQQWLLQDESHRAAYERVESMWRALEGVVAVTHPSEAACAADEYDGTVDICEWPQRLQHASTSPQLVTAPADSRRSLSERRPFWSFSPSRLSIAACLAAVAVLGSVGFLRGQHVSSTTVVETRAMESREITLADGSRLVVSGRTLVWVTLAERARIATLDRGEAFFHVAKDPHRPFSVRYKDTAIIAVGTEFDVRAAADGVVVGVAEGVVRVESGARHTQHSTAVAAGQQLSVEGTGQIRAITRIDTRAVADWRQGRFWYLDEPLESVIADLNRYRDRDIVISDPAVRQMRVTATLVRGNEDSWINSLETSLPVRIVHGPDDSVRIVSKQSLQPEN
jgi:transmembrane sensor